MASYSPQKSKQQMPTVTPLKGVAGIPSFQRVTALEEQEALPPSFDKAFASKGAIGTELPIQRQINWSADWRKHLWSDQTGAADFSEEQKFDPGETKYQMIKILQAAGETDPDIQNAIEATGTSFDENLLDDLVPWKMKGIMPDFKDPENQKKTDYRTTRRANMTESGHYLMVGEGIHKSKGDPIPHITARIYKQNDPMDKGWEGRIHHSYHIRVQFNAGTNEWEFSSIQQMK